MHRFEADGIVYPLRQLKIELPCFDLMSWLSKQTTYPKVFWKEKEKGEIRVAVGKLLSFSHVPDFGTNNALDVRLYGGMRFTHQTTQEETWHGFPQACFWLPQIEISQVDGKTEVTINSLDEIPSVSSWLTADNHHHPLDTCPPSLVSRTEMPHFSEWQNSVNHVLEQISLGHLDKLVLARKSLLHFDAPLSPWPLLDHLLSIAKQTTVFAYQLDPKTCFLGATPEKFFQKQGNSFEADAIAGTRPRGKNTEHDQKLAHELLNDAKEQKEFQFVSEFLTTSLHPYSSDYRWQWPQNRILKTSHVQHLHNHFLANLKPKISDAQLIQALHPTPALGGFPRDKVLPYLNALEPFDRGWYGAPIGYIGPLETSLYVAIRSGLIRDQSLHLFAGTGLVSSSVAEKEWEECEHKIGPFIEFFTRYAYAK